MVRNNSTILICSTTIKLLPPSQLLNEQHKIENMLFEILGVAPAWLQPTRSVYNCDTYWMLHMYLISK